MIDNKTKFTEEDLKFRQIKEKERMTFYNYAFESTRDFAENMGISFNFLEKFCRINSLFLGIPAKILMRNSIDVFACYNKEIVAGYTLAYDKKEDRYMLGNVFTRPEFQRRGIANLIMNRVISEVKTKPIVLDVNSKNIAAVSLYKKYGFIVVSSNKQFIKEIPLIVNGNPNDFSVRLAVKADLEKLDDLEKQIPKIKNLRKTYKKFLGKEQQKALRIENQLSTVLLKENKLVGIGRANWSKGMPTTAQIIATAVLPEAKEAYPFFISFITTEAQKLGLTKYIWDTSEFTKPFEDYILPYLGKPARESFRMEKKDYA